MFVYALEDGRYYISSKTMDELYKVEYGFVKMFLPKYCVEEVNCNNYEEEFYLVLKNNKREALLHFGTAQAKDTGDDSLDIEVLN
jgi:hypothetical protein